MKKAFLTFYLIGVSVSLIFAQAKYLEEVNDFVINPSDVSIIFSEQTDFYIKRYTPFLNQYKKELEEYQEVATGLKAKRRLSKKKKKYLEGLEEDVSYLSKKVTAIKASIQLWENLVIKELEESLSEGIRKGLCYEIVGRNGAYSPQEYESIDLTDLKELDWEEKVSCRVEVEIKIKNYWVKRRSDKGCLSDDPNDCLVWCFVEDEEEIQKKSCPNDMELNEENCTCMRKRVLANATAGKSRLKILKTTDGKEIEVLDYVLVDCD